MRADEDVVEGLRAVLRDRADRLEAHLAQARRAKKKGIHHARTDLRRLRTELEAFAGLVLPWDRTARVVGELHDVERAMSDARDAAVLLEDVARQRRERPDSRRDLRPLHRRTKKRLSRAERRLARRLDAETCDRACAHVRSLAKHARVRDHDPRRRTWDFTRELVWREYAQIAARADAGDPEALHRFRSSCRRLRFVLDLFDEALPGAGPLVRELRAIQDELGAMHDHDVAVRRITKWLGDGALRSRSGLERYVAERREAIDRAVAHDAPRESILGRAFRTKLVEAFEPERATRARGSSRAGHT